MALSENTGTTKYNGDYVVGFDLTDTYTQLSFGNTENDEIISFSLTQGEEDYLIPSKLYKRREVSQWFIAREAEKQSELDGFFVENLLARAESSDEVEVGDETYRISALLALYLKRLLSMANMYVPTSKIKSLMITVDVLNERVVKVLTEAVNSLGLKTDNVFFQSHMESFYYYTIYQPGDLWNHEVLLLDFSTDSVKTFRMKCNNNTTPIVAFIDPEIYSGIETALLPDISAGSPDAKRTDETLLLKLGDTMQGKIFSSAYVVGERFRQDIFPESVRFLCRKARVFEGNNLYAKGAVYAARDKIVKTILSESHVFLGNDKLKSNVGINVTRRGENAYLPLLDAGINWFEASSECDVILNQGNKLSFVITPLTGKNPEVVDITLFDLPKRPARTSRVKLKLQMLSESRLSVNIKDLGFGELFPATGMEWNEVINL